jgi:transposase
MVPIHLDERDLAHLTSMIGMLERLLEREARPSSHVVFEPAYWRTRVQSVAARPDTPRPLAERASALLARLDVLDGATVPIERNAERWPDEAPPGH